MSRREEVVETMTEKVRLLQERLEREKSQVSDRLDTLEDTGTKLEVMERELRSAQSEAEDLIRERDSAR